MQYHLWIRQREIKRKIYKVTIYKLEKNVLIIQMNLFRKMKPENVCVMEMQQELVKICIMVDNQELCQTCKCLCHQRNNKKCKLSFQTCSINLWWMLWIIIICNKCHNKLKIIKIRKTMEIIKRKMVKEEWNKNNKQCLIKLKCNICKILWCHTWCQVFQVVKWWIRLEYKVVEKFK